MSDNWKLKNYYYLSDYEAAIVEANESQGDNIEKKVYLYRSYIGANQPEVVLDEIFEDEESISLKAVRLHAKYVMENNKEEVINELKEMLQNGTSENPDENEILLIISAIIFCNEGNFDEALKYTTQAKSIESKAIQVYIFLKINRVDLANEGVARMSKIDDDHTLTQLALAWSSIFQGGEKLNEAFFIYQEMAEKFQINPMLLNGQAICNLKKNKFDEVLDLLNDSLKQDSKYPDSLANSIVANKHNQKSDEQINRKLAQLKRTKNHPMIKMLDDFEDNFERASMAYSAIEQ
eukprot:TRINITY_DN2172_c0_g1_i1.p1 TRINITY_DN2172_c0_g1~~TRINITY_DN2172_c0_g1_i1.p1  ORF type:complete len:293 (-),score=100.62 TRINITY_DN2172_c0_g1_i1:41-919(-)